MNREKKDRKIKILHLQTKLNLACGVTRTISQIIKNSSSEFEHHLIALGGDGLKRFDFIEIQPTILNLNRNSIINTIKILATFYKYCKKNSIDIVHSHHRYFDTIAWLLKHFIKTKTITSVHSKAYGRKVFSYKADKLIACSKNIKDHLIKAFDFNENNIVIIHNSVDPTEIKILSDKATLRNKLQININKKIIGFAGRFDFKEKGIDLLLKSFSEVNKKRKDVQLLLVGIGIDRLRIKSFINSENIPCTIIDAQLNIFDYINLFDIFVLPSRIEPFGIVLVEAGMMKKPVIASNVDGIPEIIENEITGLLFEKENVNQLTDCISRILNKKQLADELAENLHRKVGKDFLTSKMVEQYQQEYKKLIGLNVI